MYSYLFKFNRPDYFIIELIFNLRIKATTTATHTQNMNSTHQNCIRNRITKALFKYWNQIADILKFY